MQLYKDRAEQVMLNRFSNAEVEDIIFQSVKNYLYRNFNIQIRRGDRMNNPAENIDINGRVADAKSNDVLRTDNAEKTITAARARINFTQLQDMSEIAKLLVGGDGQMANGKKFLHLAATCINDPRAGVIQIGDVVIETTIDQNTYKEKLARCEVDQEYIDKLQTISLKYAFS